jgi:hypothetical protein
MTRLESVQYIKESWAVLMLDNVDISTSAKSVWLVGSPGSQYVVLEKRLVARPVTRPTEPLAQAPANTEPLIYAGLDLFYECARTAPLLGAGDAPTPDLKGVSGAALWDVSGQPATGLWPPERFAKMVAVQSAFVHSEYVRAKSWLAMARVLARIDPELRDAIHDATGVTDHQIGAADATKSS